MLDCDPFFSLFVYWRESLLIPNLNTHETGHQQSLHARADEGGGDGGCGGRAGGRAVGRLRERGRTIDGAGGTQPARRRSQRRSPAADHHRALAVGDFLSQDFYLHVLPAKKEWTFSCIT